MYHDTIQNLIRTLLEKAHFTVSSITVESDDDVQLTKFIVETDTPELLIGKNGDVLRAVNYLVRRLLEEEVGIETKLPNFLIDAGNYHARRIEDIKTKARIVADRARAFKRDVELEPMPAYERLIVHSFLSGMPDIATESVGEGRDRRVVIKLKA